MNRRGRKTDCPNWPEVIQSLEKSELIEFHKGQPRFLEAGLEAAERERGLHPDGLRTDPLFRIHVGPIGTGKTVRKDPEIFERLAKFQRKVVGLEMEAAAIGYVAKQSELPSIIVKGVADYGDHDKDDSFHAFAGKASAEVLISLLKTHAIPSSQTSGAPAPRRHQLPTLDELVQMFEEIGYTKSGRHRVESGVFLEGADSRDDEVVDAVLSKGAGQLVVVTMNDNKEDELTGLLCASEMGVPFYLGMDLLQTKLVRVDQSDTPIAKLSTAEFVANSAARAKFAAPQSLSFAHLSSENLEAFEAPPVEGQASEEDQRERAMDFFRGFSDSWIPIEMGLPVDIDVQLSGQRMPLSSLATWLDEAEGFRLLTIFGPGGSGKTTASRSLAWQIGKAGDIVLCRLPNMMRIYPLEFRRSAREYSKQGRKLYLFWDSPTMLGQIEELIEFARVLQVEKNVRIIVTDRQDEWIDATRQAGGIRGEVEAQIQERLSDQQAEELFHRILELEESGHSILVEGQTMEGFKQALTSDSSRILLSAVYEATTGEQFEKILVSEYNGIPDKDAKTLYLYLCGLFAYGVTVPEELPQCMYGRFESRRLRSEALAGILFVRQHRVWPRHRTISELLWKALNPDIEAEVDVFHDFLDFLNHELREIGTGEELGELCREVCERVIVPLRRADLAQKAAVSLGELSTDPGVLLRICQLLESLGRLEEAVAVYEARLQKQPHSSIYLACGRACQSLGHPERAIDFLKLVCRRIRVQTCSQPVAELT